MHIDADIDETEDWDYSPAPLKASVEMAPREPMAVQFLVPLALAGLRLDQVLQKTFPDESRSRLTTLLKSGDLLLNGAHAAPSHRVLGGEEVSGTRPPRAEDLSFLPAPVELSIIYEDPHLVVINKAAGLVVHPAAGNWQGTVLNGVLFRYPETRRVPRAGIVHRLDKGTTGLMVVARTEAAQFDLVRQLQARTVGRQYVALVRGQVAGNGTVNAPIGRHPRDRTRMAVVDENRSGKHAVTHYRVMRHLPHHTLLECTLETGRTHQIRVHMASIGHPLEGDATYAIGSAVPNTQRKALATVPKALRDRIGWFRRQALHAERLRFRHPASGDELQFSAPAPDDMNRLIEEVA
jgi:23S rRNA pseudouridine1911/1915/1917 synthase